jgi:hypothetical protein
VESFVAGVAQQQATFSKAGGTHIVANELKFALLEISLKSRADKLGIVGMQVRELGY